MLVIRIQYYNSQLTETIWDREFEYWKWVKFFSQVGRYWGNRERGGGHRLLHPKHV